LKINIAYTQSVHNYLVKKG